MTSKYWPALLACWCGFATAVLAGDQVRSLIIDSNSDTKTINVSEFELLRIRVFAQDAPGSARGVIKVDGKVVMTAALVDTSASRTPEPIKSVAIGGPATVTIAPVTGASLFLTYKKHLEAPATPTPTATPTATPTPTP